MPYDFFDLYDEHRQLDVSVNFSFIYEEWKRRNHIYLSPVALPPVVVRHVPPFGSAECCLFWDGAGILPTIFVVWYTCQWLIWYCYGPTLSGTRDPFWETLSDWWSETMAGEENAQEGILDPEEQLEVPPDSQLGAVPGNTRTESGGKTGKSPSANVEEWLQIHMPALR